MGNVGITNVCKKVSALSAAFVLTLSSSLAALPLFLNQSASALSSPVVINEVSANSAPEWVELHNSSDEDVDISGWYLRDATNSAIGTAIPADTIIPAHGYYTVDGGGAVLNNAGDTVLLYSATDVLLDRINHPAVAANQTYGRSGAAGVSVGLLPTATKGAQNPTITNTAVYNQTQQLWYGSLANAAALAFANDVLVVHGTQVVTGNVQVKVPVTITGAAGAKIQTSGTAQVITIVNGGAGTTISNLAFEKTDTANQSFIGIQANDVTIENSSFTGQWHIGDSPTVRGLVVSPGRTGYTIENNQFVQLRQPAYIDGVSNGAITNNYTHDTKGWVVETDADIEFSGNTWGTNVLDIALIPGSTNLYPDTRVVQISDQNNDAVVENQFGGTKLLSDAYVQGTANGNVGDEGSKWNPYTSVASGVSRVVAGGTVHVASGTYTGDVTITKPLSLVGPNANVAGTGSRVTEAVVKGQISVYSGDVTVSGLTVTNPAWNGATIKGIHVYSNGPVISNITIQNNILTDINNANTKGAYGIMVQGVTNNVRVLNNKVTNIGSAGWAHGVEITPTGSNPVVPQNTTITGNLISNITNASGLDQYALSVDASGAITADASQITLANNQILGTIRNLDAVHALDASSNWWGNALGASPSKITGNVTVDPWCTDTSCATTQTQSSGTTSLPAGPIALPVNGSITVPDTNNVVTTLTTPQGVVHITIPKGVTVTASDLSWDGTITAPTLTTANIGANNIVAMAIEVGPSNMNLTFDKAVRIVLPGQAGKLAGFIQNDVLTPITAVCSANSQAVGDAEADCYMSVGNDLVIWTNHFTKFVAYTTNIPTVVTTAANRAGVSGVTTTVNPGRVGRGVLAANVAAVAPTNTAEEAGEVKAVTTEVPSQTDEVEDSGSTWFLWAVGIVVLGIAIYAAYHNRLLQKIKLK